MEGARRACRFGSTSILALASTCKAYAHGLRAEVLRATALVPAAARIQRHVRGVRARARLRHGGRTDLPWDMPGLVDPYDFRQMRGALHVHVMWTL